MVINPLKMLAISAMPSGVMGTAVVQHLVVITRSYFTVSRRSSRRFSRSGQFEL